MYGKCNHCGDKDYLDSEGHCKKCAQYLAAGGFFAKMSYGTCKICGKPKFDLNSRGICGTCRH